jgi:hypothetical protein
MSPRINRSPGKPPAWPPRQGRTCPHRRRTLPMRAGPLVAMLVLAVTAAVVLPGARADAVRTARDRDGTGYNVSRVSAASTARRHPLVFGIYPGGAAGTVGPSGRVVPDDPGKALAALEELRPPGRPFVVHLYASYSGPDGWSAADQVGRDVARYTAARLQVELVLTYRPSDGGSTSDVAGFAAFARDTVRSLGSDRRFISVQVTNEANVGGAPNASDGYYAGAKDALIKGVIAAKEQVRLNALHRIKVGFNWAYSTDDRESDFWRYLGRHGARAFAAAVDWVGLDIYPGTWSPPRDPSDLSGGTSLAIESALRTMRQRYIPLAGIRASVPLHISENGYPTGPGRTEAMQVTAMKAAIAAIESQRAGYNVTDYRWFDLRDADSTGNSFESRYGLLNDDYSPKAAFAVYRDLVASLSATRARRTSTPRVAQVIRRLGRERWLKPGSRRRQG